jgi:hypothetical protein
MNTWIWLVLIGGFLFIAGLSLLLNNLPAHLDVKHILSLEQQQKSKGLRHRTMIGYVLIAIGFGLLITGAII